MAYETPNVYGPYFNAGAPSAGVNEVQTLTLGGTPTGGTFRLSYEGAATTPITWVNVNATLLASINAALDALRTLGTAQVVATAGTLTAGVGTILLTFSGSLVAKQAVSLITVTDNQMTGTSPTAAVTETTAGVTATARDSQKGAILIDTAAGTLYQNTGTQGAPTWTAR